MLQELGFNEVPEKDSRKISLHRPSTKVLTVQGANARLIQQINGNDSLDKYGQEVLSIQASLPIYTYKRVGVMSLPHAKTLWDLALSQDLSQTEHMVGLRVIMTRFLAQALADLGILCYWGTVKDDTIIVMKQNQSFGEAVLIDLSKRMVYSNGGELKMGAVLKIIRKDKEVKNSSAMNREELISFLSVNSCLLSFNGITPSMKRAIYDLSAQATASYAASETGINL